MREANVATGRPGDAQGGRAQLSENQDVVQKGVQQHGHGEDGHAHDGLFRAALHPDVHGAGGVEHVADAHDAQVRRPQLHQPGVVGDQSHDAVWEQQQRQRHRPGDGQPGVQRRAHAAVDSLHIALAPVLAHQNGQAADEAQNDDLHQKDRGVGGGDGGQLVLPQQPHHEGVHKAQGGRDEVLQNQRQGQTDQPPVKPCLPAEIIEHNKRLLRQYIGYFGRKL